MKSLVHYLLLLALTLPSFAHTETKADFKKIIPEIEKLSAPERNRIIDEVMAARSPGDQAVYQNLKDQFKFPNLEASGDQISFKIEGHKFTLSHFDWEAGSYRLNGVQIFKSDSFEEMVAKMNPKKSSQINVFSFFIPSAHANFIAAGAFIMANWKTIVVIATAIAGVAVIVGWPYLSVSSTAEVEIQEVGSECEILKNNAIKRTKKTGEKNEKIAAEAVLKTNSLLERLKALKNREPKVIGKDKSLKAKVQRTEGCVEEAQKILTAEIQALEKAKHDESQRATKSTEPAARSLKKSARGTIGQ